MGRVIGGRPADSVRRRARRVRGIRARSPYGESVPTHACSSAPWVDGPAIAPSVPGVAALRRSGGAGLQAGAEDGAAPPLHVHSLPPRSSKWKGPAVTSSPSSAIGLHSRSSRRRGGRTTPARANATRDRTRSGSPPRRAGRRSRRQGCRHRRRSCDRAVLEVEIESDTETPTALLFWTSTCVR